MFCIDDEEINLSDRLTFSMTEITRVLSSFTIRFISVNDII